MKRYPQLEIEVKIDNTVHICELLQSNKIDVGLVEGETGDKKFHKEEFYIDRLVLIGPIGSPKKMQRRDLETVTWITREQGSGTRVQWEEFLEKNSVLPAKTIIFNTNFAVKEAKVRHTNLRPASSCVSISSTSPAAAACFDRADRKPQKDAAPGSGNSNVDNARTGIGHKGAVGRVFREK